MFFVCILYFSEYPYKGSDGLCKASDCTTLYNKISSYSDVTHHSEDDLETAVASGCVSVAIEADQFAFQFYSGGVLDGTCGTSLDHGVLVVGYGTDGDQVMLYLFFYCFIFIFWFFCC